MGADRIPLSLQLKEAEKVAQEYYDLLERIAKILKQGASKPMKETIMEIVQVMSEGEFV